MQAQVSNSGYVPFDDDWLFFRGGVERGEYPAFIDSDWKTVSLPHDWSIEDIPGTPSPFNPDAVSQVSGGFTVGGVGWYRKKFTIPSNQTGKGLILLFDGVYMNADVWLNGVHLGNHPYGYTSFWFDITEKLIPGKQNILAVQVKNEGQNSRWYAGSGINRHVWLKYVNPIHIAQWGTFISTPQSSASLGLVRLQSKIENKKGARTSLQVVSKVLDSSGRQVAMISSHVSIDSNSEIVQDLSIMHPNLWSPQSPYLYTCVIEVYNEEKMVDTYRNNFGIRTIIIDAQKGFQLNGTTIKLKGGCFHNDNGPLGSRAYDRAEERKVALLKASGFNAIRCSHNPPAPAFLEACDRLGMLVIDEAFDMWQEGKNPYDYHLYFSSWWGRDMESMILRDRNHPSIVMWSIGNEIPNREKPSVVAIAKQLTDCTRKLDPSRAITAAVNDIKNDKDPYFEILDVAGYNYGVNKYVEDHQRKPSRVMMATESFPLEAFDYWMAVKDHPYVIGDFVWTAFDYIGEASIGWRGYFQEKNFYPWNLAYCGDIDICGWKRPQSYYRDVLWKPNQISLFVKPPQPSFESNPNIEKWSRWNWQDVVSDWNWTGQENKSLEVVVYSSCDVVELFLNGFSLGKKAFDLNSKFMNTWNVPYKVGSLTAVGYTKGKKTASAELHSAESPTRVKLSADRSLLKADGQDLSYITIELVDSFGIRNPKAENLVQCTIEGNGSIVGVGNANPRSLESNQQYQRKAWQGRCLVIVKSEKNKGRILLKASVEGLPSASIGLQSE
ncbi:MAG: glycoside hydrolase family 2 TIM barrel-domain containing protein [Flavisolibacter sp.]